MAVSVQWLLGELGQVLSEGQEGSVDCGFMQFPHLFVMNANVVPFFVHEHDSQLSVT